MCRIHELCIDIRPFSILYIFFVNITTSRLVENLNNMDRSKTPQDCRTPPTQDHTSSAPTPTINISPQRYNKQQTKPQNSAVCTVRQCLDPRLQRNPDTCSNQHCECENSGRFRIVTPEDGSGRAETYVGFDI
jgi:hypothetical protein